MTPPKLNVVRNDDADLDGSDSDVVTQYGRIGSAGQESRKSFASPEKAQKEYDKLVAEKLGKGYFEKSTTAAAPKPSAAKAPPPSSPLIPSMQISPPPYEPLRREPAAKSPQCSITAAESSV